MIQKIVLATDLGPFSSHIMEHALDLAVHNHAKVSVVHAVEPLSSFAQAMVATYIESDEACGGRDHAGIGSYRQFLESVRARISSSLLHERSDIDPTYDCFADVVVSQGRPAEVVLSESTRLGADLIVMGSHGPESMGNNVLGSVTTRVLQLSKVPVYMVPMISPRSWYKVALDGSA